MSKKKFEKEKQEIADELSNFLKKYDEFTKKVSPKNWRSTGTHFSRITEFIEDIKNFSEMTDEEKENFKKFIDK